jgi:hypothetical protein
MFTQMFKVVCSVLVVDRPVSHWTSAILSVIVLVSVLTSLCCAILVRDVQVQTSDQCDFVHNALLEFARVQNVSVEQNASAASRQPSEALYGNVQVATDEPTYGNIQPQAESLYGNVQVAPTRDLSEHVYGHVEQLVVSESVDI